MRKLSVLLAIGLLAATTACKSRPGYVIKPADMSEILADMHTAEALVDMDRNLFYTDSAKMALKQAVLQRHGVSLEKFDTSLVWYGRNIDKYIEVYDKTIDVLEKRSTAAGSVLVQAAMSLAGDSVDVWGASRHMKLTKLMPSRMVAFDIEADDNWEDGDVYTWRIKLIDADNPNVQWAMFANYADSTTEYMQTASSMPGWNDVTFAADSTKHLQRLRGYFVVNDEKREAVWIDSISLLRKRATPSMYSQRHRQKIYKELN